MGQGVRLVRRVLKEPNTLVVFWRPRSRIIIATRSTDQNSVNAVGDCMAKARSTYKLLLTSLNARSSTVGHAIQS